MLTLKFTTNINTKYCQRGLKGVSSLGTFEATRSLTVHDEYSLEPYVMLNAMETNVAGVLITTNVIATSFSLEIFFIGYGQLYLGMLPIIWPAS